jgi:hypothetical protein
MCVVLPDTDRAEKKKGEEDKAESREQRAEERGESREQGAVPLHICGSCSYCQSIHPSGGL